MHLYDAIEEYNFEHGKHFDPFTGQYDLLMPHDLGRPLTHEEMDYNFLYQKQTMNGFRIFGSGENYRLNIDDTDKVLKFHKIDPADDNYADYTAAGYVTGQWIWIPEVLAAPPVVTYVSLTATPNVVNETNNNTTTFTLTTINVTDNTVINWSIATGGGITAGDFVGGLTGQATIIGDTATWTVQASADAITEGPEVYTLTLAATDSALNDTTTFNGGNPLSADVTITDTSLTPQYIAIDGNNTVAEGQQIGFGITTANFFQAATVNWEIDFASSTATAADFTGATSGVINMTSSGLGIFTVTVASDLVVDAGETFIVKLVGSDSNGVPTNGISKTVTITDVAFPTYVSFTGPASAQEGDTVTYTLTGTTIPNGTQVGYTIAGINGFDINDTDLLNLSGNITMNNGSGSLSFNIPEDYIVENGEEYTITLNGTDSAGNSTGLPMNVTTTISDVAPTYQIDGISPIVEGETQTYTFRATNMTPGTTVYWELRNFGNPLFYTEFAADLTTPRTGSGQVVQVGNEVQYSFDITASNDYTYGESSEYFQIVFWDDPANYDTAPFFNTAVSGALATKQITISDLQPQWQLTTVGDPVAGGEDDQAEPEVLTFNILTEYIPVGTPYTWEAKPYGANPASAADFDGGVFPTGAGTVTAFNNSIALDSQFTTSVIADNTTEGVEQYIVELSDASFGVRASKIINITDDSQTPAPEQWQISAASSQNEGSTLQFNVQTQDVPAQAYTYQIVASGGNPANAADFQGGSFPSGSGNVAQLNTTMSTDGTHDIIVVDDLTTEGAETYTIELYNATSNLVATHVVTINDTSVTPTYTGLTAQTVNEGQDMTFTLSTANMPNGTTVDFVFSGTATEGIDYTVPGALEFTINNNTATYTIATIEDLTTEGNETVIMTLNGTDSAGYSTGALTTTGTINDTSTTPVPTFALTNNGPVNEGSPITWTLTTTNVANGTIVPFTLSGSAASPQDYSNVQPFEFDVQNNTATYTVDTFPDNLTELGAETIVVTLAANDSAGNSTGSIASTATINDTSLTPTYSTITAQTVNEGQNMTFTLSTANVANGTTVNFAFSGTATQGTDYTVPGALQMTINNNSATYTITTIADQITDGSETVIMTLNATDSNGFGTNSIQGTGTINDTSQAPIFDCADAGLSVADGTVGDPVSATVTNGAIASISPATYQSGTGVTYTAQITAPATDGNGVAYGNAGQNIPCTDTANGNAPQDPVYWTHIGNGTFPYQTNFMSTPTAPPYFYYESTGGATYETTFAPMFEDMIANPNQWTQWDGTSNSLTMNDGDTFAFPGVAGVNGGTGPTVGGGRYYLIIPDSFGIPDLTTNAKLSTNGGPDDTAVAKLAITLNGVAYTMYEIGSQSESPITVQYNA